MEDVKKKVKLLPSELYEKRQRNLAYLMELTEENLLFSYYTEAGLKGNMSYRPGPDIHGGWDGPLSHIRGTFTGHWLSAAAIICQETGDQRLKAKADYIVEEIGRCQEANGNGWAFSIPEKYLYALKRGHHFWAPQYVCHKTMMGLFDMYQYGENTRALEILKGCADWFYRFTGDISREVMDQMMDDEETGGMMELWCDLYNAVPDEKYLQLIKRYERPRLTDPLERNEDVLTNMHANTTIPEIHGCARAYEVTGEERYRKIVESYWNQAVTERGFFATGGQTDGEVWTPKGRQASRLSEMNQEHCTVYNMIRLADYLFRWSGDKSYLDYIELNIYNGLLAQAFGAEEEIVCYYLPLAAGSRKKWGSKIDDFWCCHCTAVQANARYRDWLWYQDEKGLILAQYFPSELTTEIQGKPVCVTVKESNLGGGCIKFQEIAAQLTEKPMFWKRTLQLQGSGAEFELRLRLPWWLKGKAVISVNDEVMEYQEIGGYAVLNRKWEEDTVEIVLFKELKIKTLADAGDYAAFLDGPVVLAGLTREERLLRGDLEHPEKIIVPHHEREWENWKEDYKTVGQEMNFYLKPLKNIDREYYTVYYPVLKQ